MADNFDTSNFETFMQLDDLKESFKPDLEKFQAEKEPVIEEVEDELEYADEGVEGFEGIDDNNPVFEDEDGFEADEDEDESDESEEEDEGDEPDDTQDESEEEVEYEEGDAVDVDFDTVITLPDGRELTVEDLASGYLQGTELAEARNTFQSHVQEFDTRVAGLKDVLNLAQLEADKVIEDYKDFDWEDIAVKDPQAYVENKRFLEKYVERKNALVASQQRLVREAEQKEQEAYQARSIECVQVLKKNIPNWDEPLYQNLIQFAIDLGSDEQEILKENRPSIFLALYKAYQFDKGKDRVVAKIKRVGAPKKALKPGNKTPSGDGKAAAAKAYSEGRMSQADAFKHLQD